MKRKPTLPLGTYIQRFPARVRRGGVPYNLIRGVALTGKLLDPEYDKATPDEFFEAKMAASEAYWDSLPGSEGVGTS